MRYLDEKSVEMSEQSWFLSFPCRYPASTIPFFRGRNDVGRCRSANRDQSGPNSIRITANERRRRRNRAKSDRKYAEAGRDSKPRAEPAFGSKTTFSIRLGTDKRSRRRRRRTSYIRASRHRSHRRNRCQSRDDE